MLSCLWVLVGLFGPAGLAAPSSGATSAGTSRSPEQDLVGVIEERAREFLPSPAVQLRVRSIKLPPALRGEVDLTDLTVRFRPHEDFSGTTLVHLEAGSVARWVPVDLELMVLCTVAKTALPRGHRLRAEDLEVVARPQDQLIGVANPTPEELIGLETRFDLHAKDALALHQLLRPVVVRRGDPIELAVDQNGLRVACLGLAQADGRVGDVIGVKNTASGAQLQGRVVGPGQIQIEAGRTARPRARGR